MSTITDRLRWSQPIAVRRVRRALIDARILARRGAAAWRADPSFLIVGTQRGGTTSLFRYLAQHPDIEAPLVKEVQFFSSAAYVKGWSWYRAHFPLRARLSRADGRAGAVTFEATPYYLFHPCAPARIATSLPDVKCIVVLRDPVDRAFSHYLHSVQRGYEPLSFEDALAAEDDRLDGEAERMVADAGYDSHAYRAFSYFRRGIYVDQLVRWEQHVAPERLLVLSSHTLYTDPATVYAQTLDFLGLEAWKPPEFDVFERSRPGLHLSDATRADLRAAYRPHDERLRELLGHDLDWPE